MPRTIAKTKRTGGKKVPRLLPTSRVSKAVERLAAPTGTDRYDAGRDLIATARQDPARVYPWFSNFATLLNSDNKIVRWTAQRLIGELAPADTDDRLEPLLDVYLEPIRGMNMITAANAIRGAGAIAKARPDLVGRVVKAILQVEQARYETGECRNVVIAHALDAFKDVWPLVKDSRSVREFIERQTRNPRASAARRARALLDLSAPPVPLART